MIILDTSVLSHAWRRATHGGKISEALDMLVKQEDVDLAIPGIVLQELLAKTRTEEQAARLDAQAEGLTLLLASRALHVEAARIASTCLRNGVHASAIDALIAAHTLAVDGVLFTVDDDFKHIAKHTGLRLYVM
jgi:predicted nucleic acid-binding protein